MYIYIYIYIYIFIYIKYSIITQQYKTYPFLFESIMLKALNFSSFLYPKLFTTFLFDIEIC